MLPIHLKEAIERELASCKLSALETARAELTDKYRDPARHTKEVRFMTHDLHRKAYLSTRFPATYAVVLRVLQEVRNRTAMMQPESMLDLGSGPGTAIWAAMETFSKIVSITAIEQDSELVAMGKRLGLSQVNWQLGNMSTAPLKPHDLIILSYSIGELAPADRLNLVEKAWQAANKILVIIEPGTMPGFACIRAARQMLIDLKAHPIAPCPHSFSCPMPPDDWCHFAERVSRSAEHRRLKQGTLSYEDEKYSYIAVAKEPILLPESRIVRHPQHHSGHINFFLCTSPGTLQNRTISRREGDAYKQARKLEWGDSLTP